MFRYPWNYFISFPHVLWVTSWIRVRERSTGNPAPAGTAALRSWDFFWECLKVVNREKKKRRRKKTTKKKTKSPSSFESQQSSEEEEWAAATARWDPAARTQFASVEVDFVSGGGSSVGGCAAARRAGSNGPEHGPWVLRYDTNLVACHGFLFLTKKMR